MPAPKKCVDVWELRSHAFPLSYIPAHIWNLLSFAKDLSHLFNPIATCEPATTVYFVSQISPKVRLPDVLEHQRLSVNLLSKLVISFTHFTLHCYRIDAWAIRRPWLTFVNALANSILGRFYTATTQRIAACAWPMVLRKLGNRWKWEGESWFHYTNVLV